MVEVKRVDWEKLRDLCARIYIARGIPKDDAYMVADNLITAELNGVYSHGVARMKMYMRYIDNGQVNMNGEIKILNESASTLHIDGNNCLGAVVATKAVKRGIEKAKESGSAIVNVCNSNHFGIAAYYTRMIAEEGFIGIAMTNAFPHVAPWGSYKGYLGTNPISFGAPAASGESMVLDMSTSIVARGKISVAAEKGESIPAGWAFDKDGNATTDAKAAVEGALAPIAGPKGYGLSLFIDVLSGVLSGGRFGGHLGPQADGIIRNAGVSHFFMMLDVEKFMPLEDFRERIACMTNDIKALPKIEGVSEIFMPGEIEQRKIEAFKKEGIPLGRSLLSDLKNMCNGLSIEFNLY